MSGEQACPQQVSDGGRWPTFHRCGRPVKRDGLCGLHASAKERAARKADERNAERIADKERKADAEATLAELGIKGRAAYDTYVMRYTGEVVVSVETLRDLATR